MMKMKLFAIFSVIFLTTSPGHAAKILLVPGPMAGSRLSLMNFLGTKLADRGQNVTIFVNTVEKEEKVVHKSVRYEETKSVLVEEILPLVTTLNIDWKHLSTPANIDELMRLESAWCEVVLTDDVAKRWQVESYQVAVVDGSSNLCVMGLLRSLDIPYIIFYSSTFGLSNPADPAMSSYVPAYGTSYTDHMNFMERFHNFIMSNVWGKYVRAHFYEAAQSVFDERYPDFKLDLEIVSKEASIFLLNSDYTLDYIRPLPPSIVMIGGFHCQQRMALPKELSEWMSAAASGVVVVALGTTVDLNQAPDDIIMPLINAFNHLTSYRFIIISRNGINIPTDPHIRVITWINLQSLLGHEKARLFINHGGSSSLLESICHGLPVLGLPIFHENLKNLVVLRSRGMAEILGKTNLTSEVVAGAIHSMIVEPSYKDNSLKQAMLLRDQPLSPINRAIYWVEYVARHNGAKNLRCSALDMGTVARYQLDVLAVLVGIPTLVTFMLLLALPAKPSTTTSREPSSSPAAKPSESSPAGKALTRKRNK